MSGIPMLIPKWILKKIGFTGTKSEVQAAISSGRIKDGDTVTITDDSADELTALSVSYDNTTSGMSATSVQGAVDELNNDLTDIQSEKLTGAKGAITSNSSINFSCNRVVMILYRSAIGNCIIAFEYNQAITIAGNVPSNVTISISDSVATVTNSGSSYLEYILIGAKLN